MEGKGDVMGGEGDGWKEKEGWYRRNGLRFDKICRVSFDTPVGSFRDRFNCFDICSAIGLLGGLFKS
jgi:hypothetical protein